MTKITPQQFIQKWQASKLKEKAASHEHFLDLCHLLDHETPAQADPDGTWFTFEYGAQKTTGSKGFADVWKKNFFGWEYKGKHKDLKAAYAQLQQYAPALANPPLLIVCDTDRFIIHTNWNDLVSEQYEIALQDLADPDKLNLLRYAFFDTDKLKPATTRQKLTEDIAKQFAAIAEKLRKRNHEPHLVAHFMIRLVFCMFAEDSELLPKGLFTDLLQKYLKKPDELQKKLSSLFAAMKGGGAWGADNILWFNGGLFDDDNALKLLEDEIQMIFAASKKDWSDIDPSIMGTLFERGLNPDMQSQLGAHYTDRETIMKIISPVVIQPLQTEWHETQAKINEELAKAKEYLAKKNTAENASQATKAENRAKKAFNEFKDKISQLKILDPACGSGNFLYLSLKALKDIEHAANIFGEVTFQTPQAIPAVGPENIYGIELNAYAAELARISVWIGEIQWIKKHGFTVPDNPVLRDLKNIACHDALINDNDTEYKWPKVNVVVGNPPFIGDRKMIKELGEEYTFRIRKLYEGKVPGGADFVCYWFAKCTDYMTAGWLDRAGLVSTSSIRGGMNRFVLDKICEKFQIYDAWPTEEWVNEGANVEVSLTCYSREKHSACKLNGQNVDGIFPDLTAKAKNIKIDTSKIKPLKENKDCSFIGTQKNGPFDISGEMARQLITSPANPNGKKNTEVIKPWVNGMDLVRRPSDMWIIDFGTSMSQEEASLFEAPFAHVEQHVKPLRANLRRNHHRERWWLYGDTRPAMRKSLSKMKKYICTPRVSKHRLFVWLDSMVQPDCATVAIAKDDNVTFGILSSRFHTLWALKLGTSLEDRPRYTPSSTFETFPFPKGMEPNKPASEILKNPKAKKIEAAAENLYELRQNWLNPPGSVKLVKEVVSGYPDRIVAKSKAEEKILKKRTLTNLYNEMPTWLRHAHKALDDAVAEAYGWPLDLSDSELLERLYALNQQRNKGDN
jgi:type II restriction/modification system DNA methylase subunit YeeA